MTEEGWNLIDVGSLSRRQKYRLQTSLVVPRPIAWVSTRSADGVPNLAPFSYFNAVSSEPMLVAVSIGSRRGLPKDTLVNIRDSGAFCLNMVTERHLQAMSDSSGEFSPDIDEFKVTGLTMGQASAVDAPYVVEAPAILECRTFREVSLGESESSLVIGEVIAIRLCPEAEGLWDRDFLDVREWVPVGRLWGGLYSLVTDTPQLERPETVDPPPSEK
jgi:flavin reductase (DIM6/NTAB) family NADH-FMN oxidoreductase RutF